MSHNIESLLNMDVEIFLKYVFIAHCWLIMERARKYILHHAQNKRSGKHEHEWKKNISNGKIQWWFLTHCLR